MSYTFPLPVSPSLQTPKDLYLATYEFLTLYALPDYPAGNIYRGYQNRAALPAGSNEYAIMQITGQYRRGTNVDSYSAEGMAQDEDGTLTTRELVECDMQLDFYSDSDSARLRAQTVETLARSGLASQFFTQSFDVGCLYAGDLRDLSGITDADQYVQRFSVTLRLCCWVGVNVKIPWFDAVAVGVKDVDVYYPPKEII